MRLAKHTSINEGTESKSNKALSESQLTCLENLTK
jgi:hypothetical protein